MKRLVAVLVAIGLVAGAIVLRRSLDGEASGGADVSGDGATTVICGSELRRVCDELASRSPSVTFRIEDEAVTADRLSDPQVTALDADGWLAAGPWAAIVADNRAAAGAPPLDLGAPSAVLGRSPAVIVAAADRAAALQGACPSGVTWACIGGFAGRPWTEAGGQPSWGAVRPGLAPPETGSGLVVWSQAVSSQTAANGLPAIWARNDLDDPVVSTWFDQLAGQAKRSGSASNDPLARFLVAPATFGAVGALESAAGPAVARAAGRSDTRLLYPEPMVSAEVTLTPAAGGDAGDLLDALGGDGVGAALARDGWRVAGQPPAAGIGGGPPAGDSPGLPSAGALEYLRQRWEAVP